jgi:hypothetical protein
MICERGQGCFRSWSFLPGYRSLRWRPLYLPTQAVRTVVWGECPRPPIGPCFTQRGRLSGQNGIPHLIWLVGTKRIVAVDNEVPGMLLNYLDMTSAEHSDIHGDYDMCPVEHDRPAHMRRVCVSGANRLVAQDRDRTHPAVRLLATWPKENR